MNKDELIRLIYTGVNASLPNNGFTLKAATEVYENLVNAMKTALYNGEEVRFPTFGKFYVNHSGPRTIPHPKQPGQTLEVAATKQLRFKAFPKAKDELNDRV